MFLKKKYIYFMLVLILILICFLLIKKKQRAKNYNYVNKENTNMINNYEIVFNDELNEYVIYDKDTGLEIDRSNSKEYLKIYEIDPDYKPNPIGNISEEDILIEE